MREGLDDGLLVSSWYDFDDMTTLTHTIDRVLGAGDLGLCRDMGRFACDRDFTTIYRIFFEALNIHFLIKRASEAWAAHYDQGEMVALESSKKHAVVRLTGVPDPEPSHCGTVRPWIERAGEMTGCRNTQGTVEQCRKRGDQECRWRLDWD